MSSTQEAGLLGQVVQMGHVQRHVWGRDTSEVEGVHGT